MIGYGGEKVKATDQCRLCTGAGTRTLNRINYDMKDITEVTMMERRISTRKVMIISVKIVF